jgi:FkbM family methyltransferase
VASHRDMRVRRVRRGRKWRQPTDDTFLRMTHLIWAARRAVGRTKAYPYLKGVQERVSPAHRRVARQRVRFYRQFIPVGGLAYDIGANMGNRTEAFLALGARVVAIEPQPRCTATLAKRFGSNPRLTLIPAGLAAQSGTAELHVATNHVLSSMSDEFVARMDYQHNEWTSTERVRVATLDGLLEVFGVPDFCKIDVEGYELAVLRGLSQPLPALSIEHNPPVADATVECLQLISALAPNYEFAYSAGESMVLDARAWMGLDETLERISTEQLPFGDFYARLT